MAKKETPGLPQSSEWARVIIDKAPAGIMIMDREGRVTDFNPAAAAISGYSREEALGRPVLEVLATARDREDCPIKAAMRGQEVEPQEIIVLNRGQEAVPVMLSAFPLKEKGGAILGGVIIFRDLSSIKRLEKERRHLVNMFAHDLKTPVVGMAGLVRRLRQGKAGPLTEPQMNYLETIDREMGRLEKLINNFLEFARLDLHLLTPLPSALQVERECQEVLALLQPLAEAKGIVLDAEYPQELLVIQADPLLFRRTLENLLENAIKYSPPRTTVTLEVQDRGQEVLFAVKDQGPGIAPEDLPHLFEIYYRGADAEKERGFGVGLATVKRIIDAHGGRIWVDRPPGQGATFRFTLPREGATA
ncbi:MAG: PAS domain-containing sensor histidine kinase [Thermodesulfobacteriota bacterium]